MKDMEGACANLRVRRWMRVGGRGARDMDKVGGEGMGMQAEGERQRRRRRAGARDGL